MDDINDILEEAQRERRIKNARQMKAILEPIPADRWVRNSYGNKEGRCCFLGHIHVFFSADKDPTNPHSHVGDSDGYGARRLTGRFLEEKFGLQYVDGTDVNNDPDINGYTEPEIKDRVMHMIEDMIAFGM